MATFTSAANTGATEMDMISSIVQEELVYSAKLRPTVKDVSSMATKGLKSLELPRFDSHFASPADQNPDGVTAVDKQTVNFATDVINLDKWKTLPYEVPDRVSRQTMIPLEAELATAAGKTMGRHMDEDIIVELRKAADGSGGLPDHRIQLENNTNTEISLGNITEARKLLNKANVSESDRYLLISPCQEKAILDLDTFRNADTYGSDSSRVNGEIGRLYGFRVIVHNALNDAEAIAYQRDAVAIAVQREVRFETRRAQLCLQKTEYAFSVGWGATVLEQGVKQVLINDTGL